MTFACFTKIGSTAQAVHGAVRAVLMHGVRV
jgi:hypothetical protein